jgi:prepilin-type processing-associated H-X9-DG protein
MTDFLRSALCFVAAMFVTTTSLLAHPLADRVSGDARVYVGWSGAEAMPGDLANSRWGAILAESRWRELFTTYLDAIEARVAQETKEAKPVFDAVRSIGAPYWKYPSAFVLGPTTVNPNRRGEPMMRFAVLCQAGADAEKLQAELARLLDGAPEEVSVGITDGIVVLSFGFENVNQALASGADALAKNPAFIDATGRAETKDIAASVYLNIESLWADVDAIVAANARPQDMEKYKLYVDALGVRGVKSVAITTGLSGRDWATAGFVAAPGPRKGLLKALGSDNPVPESLLKAVPQDASLLMTFKLDLAAVLRTVRDDLTKADPQIRRPVRDAFVRADGLLGKGLIEDVLDPLGDDWAMYCSPSTSGTNLFGFVLVNPLDGDATKVTANLKESAQRLLDAISAVTNQLPGRVKIKGRLSKVGGIDVYHLGTPIIAPAWTIDDGKLYAGLFPQNVAAAVRKARAKGPSILENAKYKEQIARLNVPSPTSVMYIDLEEHARTGGAYGGLQILFRLFGIGDLFNAPMPEPVLPTLDVIVAQTTPMVSAGWRDEAGFYFRTLEPYPMSGMLIDQGSGMSILSQMQQPLMAASILLPSLNRARETANRAKSMSNLKQIGTAIRIYEMQNNNRWPDNLLSVAKETDLPGDLFLNPRTGVSAPANLGAEERLKWAIEQNHYVYISGFTSQTATAETIVAFENPNTVTEGVSVLFGDGHVEWMTRYAFDQAIQKQPAPRGGGL